MRRGGKADADDGGEGNGEYHPSNSPERAPNQEGEEHDNRVQLERLSVK